MMFMHKIVCTLLVINPEFGVVAVGVGSGYTEEVNEHNQAEVHETFGPEAARDRSFDAPNEQYANNEAERAAMGHDHNANAPLMDDEEVCTLSSSMSTAASASVSTVASAANFWHAKPGTHVAWRYAHLKHACHRTSTSSISVALCSIKLALFFMPGEYTQGQRMAEQYKVCSEDH